MKNTVHDIPQLRDQTGVFRDRKHAGRILAGMLGALEGTKAIVLAIPCGGIPVAVEIAVALSLPLDVAVVSKILLPWNSEAGFGAIGFDDSIWVNDEYAAYYRLDKQTIEQQTKSALEKVQRRVRLFRGNREWPDPSNQTIILVDDGIAAGSTMQVALKALRNMGATRIIVAVPTAHQESLAPILNNVDDLYCANIRSGNQFAVASAYLKWDDVDEADACEMMRSVS